MNERLADDAQKPLQGLRVLATRPAHQSAALLARLNALGAIADNFPTIEVIAVDPAGDVLERVGDYDLAIFISANAVVHGLAALARTGVALSGLPPVAAVGRTTAQLLEAEGVSGVAYPPTPSSEALLETSAVKALSAPGKVVIFRGRGGKEVLAVGLRTRGLAVDYAEVYERRKPAAVSLSFTDPLPDLILVTSRDGLQNLYEMTEEASRPRLLETPVVLGSRAMLALYRRLGFQRDAVVAQSPLDADVIAAVTAWRRR